MPNTPFDLTPIDAFLKMMATILNHVQQTQSEMIHLTKIPAISLPTIEQYATQDEMLYWLQMHDIADQQLSALIMMLEGMKQSIDLYLVSQAKELPHLETLTYELNALLEMAKNQKSALQGNAFEPHKQSSVDFFE